jgi:hypothetical protein
MIPTLCPPAPHSPALRFDKHQFAGHPHHPVEAHSAGEAGWESNGVAFEDYARMNVRNSGVTAERRNPTPTWANSNEQLAQVVCRHMEFRAGMFNEQQGTVRERMARAQQQLLRHRPALDASLTRLCKQYSELKETVEAKAELGGGKTRASRLRKLAEEIKNVDTQLRVLDRAGALTLAVAFLYYRNRYNSWQVAEHLGTISPNGVRILLMRLDRTWARMQDPAFSKRTCVPRHIAPGTRFGKLVVQGQEVNSLILCERTYPCLCDCGKRKHIRKHNLLNGLTNSCGCLRRGRCPRPAA